MICGPTATGKSGLALAVAERFEGTVINADALQLYRELSIVTARPRAADLERAPHRLYGVLDAENRCSAGQWRDMAMAEIARAHADGRLPLVVGGTGLYLRALLHGLTPIPSVPQAIKAEARRRMDELGPAAFHRELTRRDPAAAARIAPADHQRQVRAWEVLEATGRSQAEWTSGDAGSPPGGLCFLTVLLNPPREDLYAACDARFDRMLRDGALDEVRALQTLTAGSEAAGDGAAGDGAAGDGAPVVKAVGVRPILRHLKGEISLDEARELARRDTRRYAKRQTTWFRNQMTQDHELIEQYSESMNDKIFSFISNFLLTHPQ